MHVWRSRYGTLPYLSGPCTWQTGIKHSAHHAQMQTWACTNVEWLAGWLAATATHSLEMCAKCMSHTVAQPAEDSPRYKKSSNAVVASRM